MNRYKLLIAALLVLAGGVLLVTFRPSRAGRDDASVSAEKESDSPARAAAKSESASNRQRTKTKPSVSPEQTAAEPENSPATKSGSSGSDAAEPKTAREKAVEAWESLVDQLVEQKDASPQEQATRVKEAFDKLDKEDQMDGIHRSLNLLPDEQFPSLYGILFDKAENAEVLDAIFSDALNRPEELKNPLMKELIKDKTHPCFFEAARILDVIGELEPKSEPTASP